MSSLVSFNIESYNASVNYATLITFAGWVSLIIACFAVRTACRSKLISSHKLIQYLLTITVLLDVAFTIAVRQQIRFGLGWNKNQTSDHQEYFALASYASNIIYVLALFFSKISTCAALMAIAPSKLHRLPTLAIELTVLVWTVWSLTAIIRGHDSIQFWTAFSKLDALTEAAIIFSPINLVREAPLSLQRKSTICFAFCLRALPAVAASVFFFNTKLLYIHASPQRTIVMIAQLFFAILAACAPHLALFKESLHRAATAIEPDTPKTDVKIRVEGEEGETTSRSNGIDLVGSNALKSRGNSPMPFSRGSNHA